MLSVLSRQPNAALNLTVCHPGKRLVTCEVVARAKCRQTRFETMKRQRNISRTLNGGVEDTKELTWCWRRRVRAAERPAAHLGRFQTNLESEVPVASLLLLTCVTGHLFTSVSQMLISIPCDHRPTLINWWRIG